MGVERPNEAASTGDFEFAALNEACNYRSALIQEFAAFLRGKVIEVGAGIGQITTELDRLPDLESLVSIEPDPKFCREFRHRFPDKKLIEGTIADLQQKRADLDRTLRDLKEIRTKCLEHLKATRGR